MTAVTPSSLEKNHTYTAPITGSTKTVDPFECVPVTCCVLGVITLVAGAILFATNNPCIGDGLPCNDRLHSAGEITMIVGGSVACVSCLVTMCVCGACFILQSGLAR